MQEYYSNPTLSRLLAEAIVDTFKLFPQPTSLLDMGCGSGAVTKEIFKMYNCGNINKISLVDIKYPPEDILNNKKIEFIQSNFFENVPFYKYDRIYALCACFTEEEYYLLNQIKNIYYPKEAYCVPAGENKFYFLQNIMQQGCNYLSDNGVMILYCYNDDFINFCEQNAPLYNLIFKNIIYKMNFDNNQLEQFAILQKRGIK